MKTAKKTIKTILALLPMLGLVMLMLTSFNAKTETYPLNASVALRLENQGRTGYFTTTTANAINVKLIYALYGRDYDPSATLSNVANVSGTNLTLAKLANTLSEITGIPLTYTLIPLWYAFYLFMIEFLFMITNIITFIPRKCSEFFGG